MKKYIGYFNTWRGYFVEAENKKEAREKLMSGEFNENNCIKGEEEFDCIEVEEEN